MTAAVVIASAAAAVLAGLRWLRVAQREHYLPGRTSRFALRWWFGTGPNAVIALATAIVLPFVAERAAAGLIAAAAVAAGPLGLPVRGRTAKLAWTRRLRTLAAVAGLVWVAALLAVAAPWEIAPAAVVAAIAVPLVVDLALAITAPIERRLGDRFVEQAAARVRQVDPTVVAITGSYGKTSTKGFVAHFLAPSRTVVASPRSFNNRAGLARAVNENLTPGTDVFVAEMGTYGKGEIAELCRWLPPRVAAITAIGPVHLERFRTEDAIVEAKSEILEPAAVAVLNVDDPRLAALADRRESSGQRVIRCSASDPAADVAVMADEDDDGKVVLVAGGRPCPPVGRPSAPLTNVAVAAAIAIDLGAPPESVAALIPTVPAAANRATVGTGAGGFTIIDDTYNSNPAGAVHALELLRGAAVEGGRAVVVTPGMVELGPRQGEENRRFAEAAAGVATDVVVVGYTNRRALLAGLRGRPVNVVAVDTREDAVDWVKAHLHSGDVVLYENDLPDHFP